MINFDGNYFDAFNFAALATLSRYRHRIALESAGGLRVYNEQEKQRKPFTLNQLPMLFTFAILNGDLLDPESAGDCFVMDPTVC